VLTNIVLYRVGTCICSPGHPECDHHFVLTDFGFSKPYHGFETQISSQKSGTQCYRAPELSSSGQFSVHTDMWAFGCILLEVARTGIGNTAFSHDGEAQLYIHDPVNRFPGLVYGVNNALDQAQIAELNGVARLCLDPDPGNRPMAEFLHQNLCRLNWS